MKLINKRIAIVENYILQILQDGDNYGVEIVNQLKQRFEITFVVTELYEYLDSLADRKFVTNYWEESGNNRGGNRKRMYKISDTGREEVLIQKMGLLRLMDYDRREFNAWYGGVRAALQKPNTDNTHFSNFQTAKLERAWSEGNNIGERIKKCEVIEFNDLMKNRCVNLTNGIARFDDNKKPIMVFRVDDNNWKTAHFGDVLQKQPNGYYDIIDFKQVGKKSV